MDTVAYKDALGRALAQLAMPYSEQVASVPDYVEAASDFASEFAEVRHLALQLYRSRSVSRRFTELVAHIHELLDLIQRNHSDLWTNKALRSDQRWALVRELASIALSELDDTIE